MVVTGRDQDRLEVSPTIRKAMHGLLSSCAIIGYMRRYRKGGLSLMMWCVTPQQLANHQNLLLLAFYALIGVTYYARVEVNSQFALDYYDKWFHTVTRNSMDIFRLSVRTFVSVAKM
jgi:hypothetical protein